MQRWCKTTRYVFSRVVLIIFPQWIGGTEYERSGGAAIRRYHHRVREVGLFAQRDACTLVLQQRSPKILRGVVGVDDEVGFVSSLSVSCS